MGAILHPAIPMIDAKHVEKNNEYIDFGMFFDSILDESWFFGGSSNWTNVLIIGKPD